MNDIASRLAKLSPEKRKLLELLNRQQATAPDNDAVILEDRFFSLKPDERPSQQDVLEFYNKVSQLLDSSAYQEYSLFLNWGYVANENPQYAQIKLPDNYINKNCTRLVLELIGDCPLHAEQHLLDIGCGRGGTIFVLRQFFSLATVVGLDLSSRALAFCQRQHDYPNTYFLQGDAQSLPIQSASFDIVTNLESSHSYPEIADFYREVYRVLKPGGFFLYSDLLPDSLLDEYLDGLRDIGFVMESQRDITSNVLLSCDDIADHHAKAFTGAHDQNLIDNFLGAPNSRLNNDLKNGFRKYLLFRFRKPQ